MQRAPGWTRLAGIALELTALAFIAHVVMQREQRGNRTLSSRFVPAQRPAPPDTAPVPPPSGVPDPTAFIIDPADNGARYYRAESADTHVLAAFYSDGRLRVADAQQHRLAGMLQNNHADVLDLSTNSWSEIFVHVTPAGAMQLELRGGPYDSRVLTCDELPFDKLSPSTSSALRQAQDDEIG
ncbi:MAG TPA: hypothetical protein VFH72_13720 [Candidatus Baltobacteraceae bacterium]|nr:hypothetical protein [Candidatus Baltobacteraceae bacterium]